MILRFLKRLFGRPLSNAMSVEEASELMGKLYPLFENPKPHFRAQSSLPTTFDRMRQAFKIQHEVERSWELARGRKLGDQSADDFFGQGYVFHFPRFIPDNLVPPTDDVADPGWFKASETESDLRRTLLDDWLDHIISVGGTPSQALISLQEHYLADTLRDCSSA